MHEHLQIQINARTRGLPGCIHILAQSHLTCRDFLFMYDVASQPVAVVGKQRCFSACRQLRKVKMGSMSENYQCPWCRRTNGGYSPDWVGYAICTQGAFSCLWHHSLDNQHTGETVVDLFKNGWALHYVFVKKFDVGWCTRVWEICAPGVPLESESDSWSDLESDTDNWIWSSQLTMPGFRWTDVINP